MSTAPKMISRGPAARERNDALVAQMYADYTGGLTLEEVGAKYDRTAGAIYSLFRHRNLPRRSTPLPKTYAKLGLKKRAHLDALVAKMHADYMRPMTLNEVGRKYGRTDVRCLFKVRGLYIRPFKTIARQPNGSPVRYVPLTPGEIEALICSATRIIVPKELKFEWRRWSLEKRRDFVRRLRAKVQPPEQMPTTPLSAGVEAFEYGHPRAHAIMARENRGCGSHPRCSIKIISQGVIFRDQLWFWSPKTGYERGPWTKEHGRPLLHHVIFEETHGPIPAQHVVRFADGNPNNFDPANLVLASRNDVARENKAKGETKKQREITAILLDRVQNPKNDDHLHQFSTLSQRSRA